MVLVDVDADGLRAVEATIRGGGGAARAFQATAVFRF